MTITTIPSVFANESMLWRDLIRDSEQRMTELFAVIEDPDAESWRKLAAEMELQHVAPLAGLRIDDAAAEQWRSCCYVV